MIHLNVSVITEVPLYLEGKSPSAIIRAGEYEAWFNDMIATEVLTISCC